MKTPIIYLHGFNSAGTDARKIELQAALDAIAAEKYQVYTPTYNTYEAGEGFRNISEFCNKFANSKTEDPILVGTSLGGFWANTIANHNMFKSVIINPAMRPYEVLKKYVGTCKNFVTGERVKFYNSQCEDFAIFTSKNTRLPQIILLGADDPTNDVSVLDRTTYEVVPGQAHRWTDWNLVAARIHELNNTETMTYDD